MVSVAVNTLSIRVRAKKFSLLCTCLFEISQCLYCKDNSPTFSSGFSLQCRTTVNYFWIVTQIWNDPIDFRASMTLAMSQVLITCGRTVCQRTSDSKDKLENSFSNHLPCKQTYLASPLVKKSTELTLWKVALLQTKLWNWTFEKPPFLTFLSVSCHTSMLEWSCSTKLVMESNETLSIVV